MAKAYLAFSFIYFYVDFAALKMLAHVTRLAKAFSSTIHGFIMKYQLMLPYLYMLANQLIIFSVKKVDEESMVFSAT